MASKRGNNLLRGHAGRWRRGMMAGGGPMAAHRPCDACLKRTTSRPYFDLNARAGMCGTKAYSMVAAVGRHRKVRAMDMIAKQRQGYMMPTESGPRWTHVV